MITIEGAPEVAEVAKETFKSLELDNVNVVVGTFNETLLDVLNGCEEPIEFFFNDGHHDYDAVLKHFEACLPYLSDNAVIIFDDINWSPNMRKAWSEIEDYDKVAISIDLRSIGIAIISKQIKSKEKYKIPLVGV